MTNINSKWLALTLVSLAAGYIGSAQAAGVITKIEPGMTSAALDNGKAVVKFTVTGTADDSDNCGLWVDYGDCSNPDTRIVSQKEGLFPRTFEHAFTKPGGYSVKAKGQRVKTTLGCVGDASTFVTVTAPAAAAGAAKTAAAGKAAPAAPAAPSCPDGWQLVANSSNKAGEFSCSAKPPAAKMACGPGLAYFEKGSVIGCRKGK